MAALKLLSAGDVVVSGAWWSTFFDETVAQLILGELRPGELDFVVKMLKIQPGDRVFDQCCGWGRVAGPLAERGYSVIGVDGSLPLVEAGMSRWSGNRISLVHQDAGDYVASPLCDAAMNLYTSFGCSTDDAYNLRILKCMVESLKPGGRLLLDLMNPHRVIDGFQPIFRQEKPCGTVVERKSELRSEQTALFQDWIFQLKTGERFQRSGVTRLYTEEEVESLLQKAGCTKLGLFGDFEGSAFGPESERMIWVARI